jgi:uncharacterized protein (TIGR03083 family)
MTLSRDIALAGMASAYQDFGELIQPLTAQDWTRSTRCAGWTVADVAGHVVGQLTDVVNNRFEGLGTPDVTQRQVVERRGRSAAELADELLASAKLGQDIAASLDEAAWEGAAPGGLAGTLGFGIEALWYDTYVHADDIRAAIGQPSRRTDGIRASLSHVAQLLTEKGWGPATLAFDGFEAFPVAGGGRAIHGDPLAFVLAATGRADPTTIGLDGSVNVYAE